MANTVKGEVRRLADAFPVEEAAKASMVVERSLGSLRNQLHTLQGFVKDNHDLSKLVHTLPHKISHNVMVPFGKAAFFPGRLIHTNEFLVLLGESYYAECSSKQTVDILNRRGEFLQSKVAAVNAEISDLETESSFFSDTIAEAAAGIVEIREEYTEPAVEDTLPGLATGQLRAEDLSRSYEGNASSMAADDKEHEKIMARLSELELEEAAAEAQDNDNGNDHSASSQSGEEENAESDVPLSFKVLPLHSGAHEDNKIKKSEDILCKGEKNSILSNEPVADRSLSTQEEKVQVQTTMDMQNIELVPNLLPGNHITGNLDEEPVIRSPGDLMKFEEWRRQRLEKEHAVELRKAGQKAPMPSTEMSISLPEKGDIVTAETITAIKEAVPKNQEPLRSQKAFTGKVVERSGLVYHSGDSKEVKQGQTRPTSRFKMRQTGQ